MTLHELLRAHIKTGRKRGSRWVAVFDFVRLAARAEGRSILWTRLLHRDDVHQTTPFTAVDRYPELFDLAAQLLPTARRVLSFGCSTGEELEALRGRFPAAEIVGAEINPRSRRIAAKRMKTRSNVHVVRPDGIEGKFDAIFALAVLQREPGKVSEVGMEDISRHYPFARFDAAVEALVVRLRPEGLLCVSNAHYRVEDSTAAACLEAVPNGPIRSCLLFGPNGRRLVGAEAACLFRKVVSESRVKNGEGDMRDGAP